VYAKYTRDCSPPPLSMRAFFKWLSFVKIKILVNQPWTKNETPNHTSTLYDTNFEEFICKCSIIQKILVGFASKYNFLNLGSDPSKVTGIKIEIENLKPHCD